MSRTDVHRPWSVQLADPHSRHRFYRYGEYNGEVLRAPTFNPCGCRMCTGHHWRKAERRRERYAGRREARRAAE